MVGVKDVRVKMHSAQESFGQKDEQRKVGNGKLYESHDAVCLQFRDDDPTEQMVTHMEVKNGNEVNGLKAEDGFTIDALQKLKEDGELEKSVMSMDALLNGFAAVKVRPEAERLLINGNRLGIEDIEIISDITGQELRQMEFFRVYLKEELKALYTYDASKNNYKVYKML